MDEGLIYLRKLSNSGYQEAQFILGQAYADDGRYDLAYRQYLQAAKRNHAAAAFEVARLSEIAPNGVKKNTRQALEYYTKSASSGHPRAMYRMALAELHGELGLRKNVKNGIKWLNRGASGMSLFSKKNSHIAVADAESPEPLYELSIIYEQGIPPDVLADMAHSQSLLVEAAELEYRPAQYRLGFCFEHGRNGFPVNHVSHFR